MSEISSAIITTKNTACAVIQHTGSSLESNEVFHHASKSDDILSQKNDTSIVCDDEDNKHNNILEQDVNYPDNISINEDDSLVFCQNILLEILDRIQESPSSNSEVENDNQISNSLLSEKENILQQDNILQVGSYHDESLQSIPIEVKNIVEQDTMLQKGKSFSFFEK